jgi:anti-anti-sigma regulatory factor
MDLVLEVRTGRDRVTMGCHGKLIGGKEADAFRRSAVLLIGGFDKITIDLAGIRMVDCGGLGSLAGVLSLARDKGTVVKIIHASPLIVEELRLTRLDEFLEKTESMRPQLVVNDSSREAVA